MSWRGAGAPAGSAGLWAPGWQQGAGEPGQAAGQRGDYRGAASHLCGGKGAQASPPSPTPSCRGAGYTLPLAPTIANSPQPLHPLGSHRLPPAPTLAEPGGCSPLPSPHTAASAVPGAGAGGAEVQRHQGAGVGGETVVGLWRAGRVGWEVLRGAESGVSGALCGDALGPGHPRGDQPSKGHPLGEHPESLEQPDNGHTGSGGCPEPAGVPITFGGGCRAGRDLWASPT